MKVSFARSAALVAAAALVIPGAAFATEYDVDSSHTAANFTVRHMMVTNVRGSFGNITGTVTLDDKKPENSKVDVEIDTTTVYTGHQKRDEHLKSADFFDVEKFPKATFKSTSVKKAGKNKFKVTGDFTLRGVTKPITLDVTSPAVERKNPWGATVRGAEATAKLNRKDFGLNWNQALEAGGVLVGDEVTLNIEAELVRKAPAEAAKK